MSSQAAAYQLRPPAPPETAPAAGKGAPPSGAATLAPRDLRPLGRILLEDGAITESQLFRATVIRRRENVPLGQILLAHDWVSEEALIHALTRQWRTSAVDPVALPPDSRLIDRVGAGLCLKHGFLPWRRVGGVTFIACARPESFGRLRKILPADFGPLRMLLARESHIHEAVMARRSTALTRAAEASVAPAESCRTRSETRIARIAGALIAAVLVGLVLAPAVLVGMLTAWAALTLLACAGLRIMAFAAALRARTEAQAEARLIAAGLRSPPQHKGPLPLISVMVPLLRESDIAGRLVARLERLDYPRELTDILLVAEAGDTVTLEALRDLTLPRWIRTVIVPPGRVQTKPRALNYALNFCRGEIVGIWDAEDRPDPDQLHRVARGFAAAASDVACLQGQLDYFNPRSNWLARCFTIEYASWFRAMLPGVARLGLVVPLGGTTLFFRREILEDLGGWDAWNVTEDADLGVRLARRGWRTEVIATTTDEEANCRVLPWVRQRSRWLKGYAMTWGVHMRDPLALWRDLGARRFIAFQVQFVGTISQYLLAPLLWSFWLLALGLPHILHHPLSQNWGGVAIPALFTLFIVSELIGMVIGLWAVRDAKHRHLRPWVPLMHFYFPLGCLAGWKAVYEILRNPFYWDKTSHGLFDESETEGGEDGPAAPGDAGNIMPAGGCPVIRPAVARPPVSAAG
ncbi:MAG: glycosyltransferase [Paracoccus sp. (in: a-proteobacteria)]|nr:glycosyltransferase [Paracoccus sp. (in: a-proteobacteria)]